MVLDSKKIAYEMRDISTDDDAKLKMREIAGERAQPPQIAIGDTYCGVSYTRLSCLMQFSFILF